MADRRPAQPVAVSPLPEAGFFGRLDDARRDWMKRAGRRGEMGPTELHGLLQKAFPNEAPDHPSTVGHWLKDKDKDKKPSIPSLDNAYMLAVALGCRPSWLAFNDGPMHETPELPQTQRRPYRDGSAGRGKRIG